MLAQTFKITVVDPLLGVKSPRQQAEVPMSLHWDQGFERTLNQCGLVRSQWQY